MVLSLVVPVVGTMPLAAQTATGIQEVVFGGTTLALDHQLLFQAAVKVPKYGDYNTLFRATLSETGGDTIEQLTFFPEHVSLLRNTGQVQIQNRFGLFRTTERLGRVEPVPGYPAFADGSQIAIGRISPVVTSPDGRWLIYFPAIGRWPMAI